SIFRGGFTVEAAEAVVSLSDAGRSVAEICDVLRRKSLLHVEPGEGLRYAMCEGLRELGRRALDVSDELADLTRRDAAHYLARGGPGGPGIGGADRRNLEAVVDLGEVTKRPDVVLKAVIALDGLPSGGGLSRAELGQLDRALVGSKTLDAETVG